jgi:N-acetyl-1-D-myo-inositol-2-amino-2-deoxy-alpha-D-glucopyranoside deacetylase
MSASRSPSAFHIPAARHTLMTVHAHPDDETIGTGGVMAKAAAEGHGVVVVTCTRGELGEIVAPELDTPANHRRLAEIRAGELEAALAALGVTVWENLGYRDSGMMGTPGNRDPRSFWQADLDHAMRRLVWLIRLHRPDVMTHYNDFGGYGHPDHIRAHQVAIGAYYRAGDPDWYPEQLAPVRDGSDASADGGGLEPWAPAKLYEQAISRRRREAMAARAEAAGMTSWWSRPTDASPEELARWDEFMRRSTADDDLITTRVDVRAFADQRWSALLAHRTQISPTESPLMALGREALAELWGEETFILRASRVPLGPNLPETDLFAGLA